VFYNQTGISPRFSMAELRDLGIAIAILPGALVRLTIQTLYDFAVALRERGPEAEADFAERFRGHALGDVHTFAGFDEVRRREEAFLPAEELEKYADSVGHQPGAARGSR
jgi:2-methylisocitrate lyase-like PEP mutase family enzyme